MIYGIGTELVDLERIKKKKSLSALANKNLSDQELKKYAEITEGSNQSDIVK